MRLLSTAYLGDLVYSLDGYFPHKEHFIQGARDDIQGVGFAHSTEETGNDGGGKGRTYKPFLGQNISYTRGGRKMANAYERIAQQAEKHGRVQTLMHYVNKQNLCKEHKQQQKGKATGIDRVSKEDYGKAIEANIEDLLARMKTFSYRPQAVRRTYIPKAGSDQMRPLGIPAYEDKLVQGVMRKVLDQIYEGKFYSFSYGFREGKSCHQAIREINQLIMTKKISFVVDADIKGFFDNVDHEWLMTQTSQ